MIIHNPEITGSLIFPRTDGSKVVIQISSQGGLETIEQDATGSATGITPASNFSGSFTGSFLGDGSQLTGVAASQLNIDLFNAGTVAGDDNILFSDTDDSGTEKKGTFKSGLNSETVVSGSSQVSFNGIVDKPSLVSSSVQISNYGVFAELNGDGLVSSSAQISSYNTFLEINGDGVISGSSQVNADSITNFDSNVKDKLNTETVVSGSTQILNLVSIDEDNMVTNSDTKLPTQQSVKSYVDTKVAGLVDSAPDALNTLNELAAALGDDSNFATTISTTIGGKVSQSLQVISGDGLTGGGNLTTDRTLAVGAGDGISVSADAVAVDGTVLRTTGFGVVSGSSQVNADSITNFDTNVKAKLNADGVISGSSQVSLSGFSTTNLSEGTNLYYTDARVKTKLTAEDVVSGSASQVRTFLNVEDGATADQTAGEIKTAYESNADTNAFTDTLLSKLNGIEAGATADQTAEEIQDIVGAMLTGNTETGITVTYQDADGTIDFVVASQTDQNFTTALKSKLDGIETGADVTDTTNVTAAGALMDSELTSLSGVKTLTVPDNTTISAFGKTLVDDADASAARTTLGVDAAGTDNSTDVTLAGTYDYITISGQTITRNQVDASTDISNLTTANVSEVTNLYYTDARVKTKLNAETVVSGSAQINHDSTTGFVSNEHIDHSTVSITAGNGLTGGGTIAATRTLNVGAGSGISVTADAVAVDGTVLRTTGDGVVSGSAQIDVSLTTGDIALGTRTSGNYVATLGTGTGVTIGSNTGEGSSPTIAVNYGSTANTAVQGNTTIAFGGTANEITIDAGSSITLGSGGTVTIGLADSIGGNRTFSGNVTVTGNLTVNGTTTTVNSNTVNIGDNIIVLNSDEAGTPSQDGGINIERGTSTNAGLIWSEANDYWMAGLVGSEERIVVGAGNTSITTLGTITTGTWNGSVIASAYLDADTAHLSTTQTFSGAKTFSSAVTISNSTASTSTTTGALKVTGGVGVGGDIFAGADIVAYASSDERLKDNVELISDPIGKVQALKGVTWEWNDNASEAAKQSPNLGVIAQDVEKVLPQLVHDRDNGYKGVDYAKLTGLLIEAIKEQQKQIDDLKSRLG